MFSHEPTTLPVMRAGVWFPLSVSVHPPPLLPPHPHLPRSAPTVWGRPTGPPVGFGLGLCRSPGGTVGRPRRGARSSTGISSPGTVGRRCACSGVPGGSCPCGSTAGDRRCTRHLHTGPSSNAGRERLSFLLLSVPQGGSERLPKTCQSRRQQLNQNSHDESP